MSGCRGTYQARREARLLADPRSVLVEEERAWREEHRAEPDERTCPVDPELVEHLHGEKRERSSDAGTNDGVRRERRRAVLQVSVDEVCL